MFLNLVDFSPISSWSPPYEPGVTNQMATRCLRLLSKHCIPIRQHPLENITYVNVLFTYVNYITYYTNSNLLSNDKHYLCANKAALEECNLLLPGMGCRDIKQATSMCPFMVFWCLAVARRSKGLGLRYKKLILRGDNLHADCNHSIS
jgi:hypothetical protein